MPGIVAAPDNHAMVIGELLFRRDNRIVPEIGGAVMLEKSGFVRDDEIRADVGGPVQNGSRRHPRDNHAPHRCCWIATFEGVAGGGVPQPVVALRMTSTSCWAV